MTYLLRSDPAKPDHEWDVVPNWPMNTKAVDRVIAVYSGTDRVAIGYVLGSQYDEAGGNLMACDVYDTQDEAAAFVAEGAQRDLG